MASQGKTLYEEQCDLEILCQYNGEILRLYNYYSLANNSYTIDSFYNIMEYSMYKTYACKYKSSVRKILRKYSKNGEFGIDYMKKNGKCSTMRILS